MRLRLFTLLAMAALIFVAGCERADVAVFTVEGDEPGYRRGKDLIKQGRNQEALNEFLKVIEKRGLDNAPESHLEVGLLYQFHIKDPIPAIYHYQKFRELKPNSPQADLVRQRIDAATRDFAKKLLGNPLEKDLDRLTSDELVKELRRENDLLKAKVAALSAGKIVASRESETPAIEDTPATAANPPANAEDSPVQRASLEPEVAPVTPVTSSVAVRPPVPAPQPTRTATQVTQPTSRPGTTPAPTTTRPPAGNARRHVITKGDTLYSLAQKYYGNKSRWKDIYAANRDVMRSPDDYKVGMTLKIPQ